MNRGTVVIAVVLALSFAAQRADADDKAAAEAAFLKAKELDKAGRTAEACDAYARSQELDPQVGTAYNLALCYEKLGKWASAWGLFREVAQRDTNDARKKDSTKHARRLTPKLTKLLIAVEGSVPGLVVLRNGVDVTATVGIETPVDPGQYEIIARAAGYRDFAATVSATGAGMTVTVSIPVLEPAPGDGGGGGGGALDDDDDLVETRPAGRKRRLIALGVGGGGVVLAGTGLVFGGMARSKWNDVKDLCGDDLGCATPADVDRGHALVADARRLGNVSTVLVGVGLAAIAGGVILWVTAPSGDEDVEEETALRLEPSIGPDGAFVTLRGSL